MGEGEKLLAKVVCFCGHLKMGHKVKQAYSKATDTWHYTDLCSAKRCKCLHFEATTFVPATEMFDPSIYNTKLEELKQMEMDFEDDVPE